MKKVKLAIAGIACLGMLVGCRIFNPDDPFNDAMDGSAGFTASELGAMGSAVDDIMTPAASAKMSATPETLYIDKVIVPWAYDQAAGCWTRSAEATYDNATRVRYDTVWFKDANNQAVEAPTIATVASYRHVRNVTAKFYNTFAFRWDMNVAINKTATDTTFVFTGGGTGSFNGDVFTSTTVSNVSSQWRGASRPIFSFRQAAPFRSYGCFARST